MIMPATVVRHHTRCRYIAMTSLRLPRNTRKQNFKRVIARRKRANRANRDKVTNHEVLERELRLNAAQSRLESGVFKTKDIFASGQ